MGETFHLFLWAAGIGVAFMAGFWLGKSTEPKRGEQETKLQEEPLIPDKHRDMEAGDLEVTRPKGRKKPSQKVIVKGTPIGSPCAGEIRFFDGENRRGAVIAPSQGLLYAPASGKIIRLYPTGNAFLLRTEQGTQLLIRVGNQRDEMLSGCYRPRIVQNEIVNKGKLLLEFDLDGLHGQKAETEVSVSVEASEDCRDVLVTDRQRVRVGEPLLWLREKPFCDSLC